MSTEDEKEGTYLERDRLSPCTDKVAIRDIKCLSRVISPFQDKLKSLATCYNVFDLVLIYS